MRQRHQKKYEQVLKQINALPEPKTDELKWKEFFEKMAVLNPENQMSCTGHSVARALTLTKMRQGESFIASPEFLYDIGASYFDLLSSGAMPLPLAPMQSLDDDETKKRLLQLKKQYNLFKDQLKEGKLNYPASATVLILDYLSKHPLPERSFYNKHFPGWTNKNTKTVSAKFIDFPPFEATLKGKAVGCYENSKGEQLKSLRDFSGTDSRLIDFDFRLLDQSLKKGYYPIVDINTDRITIKDDFVSYAPGGSVGHSLLIVGKGKDETGPYYEVLDSWAEENMLKKNKNFKMKKFKIRPDNLKEKLIRFSLLK